MTEEKKDTLKSQCSDFIFEDFLIIAIYIIFDCDHLAENQLDSKNLFRYVCSILAHQTQLMFFNFVCHSSIPL